MLVRTTMITLITLAVRMSILEPASCGHR